MTLCSLCGLIVSSDQANVGICYFHHYSHGDDWARSNKVLCDFFHRGVVPPRIEKGNHSTLTEDGEQIVTPNQDC
jgi:hypothetical protein